MRGRGHKFVSNRAPVNSTVGFHLVHRGISTLRYYLLDHSKPRMGIDIKYIFHIAKNENGGIASLVQPRLFLPGRQWRRLGVPPGGEEAGAVPVPAQHVRPPPPTTPARPCPPPRGACPAPPRSGSKLATLVVPVIGQMSLP